MIVHRMAIASGGIRLPDLDQGVPHGVSIVVDHASCDHDAFALRFIWMLSCEVAVGLRDRVVTEHRTRALRPRVGKENEGLPRRAANRGTIRLIQVGRLAGWIG